MNNITIRLAALRTIVVLALIIPLNMFADEFDHATKMTFNEPVEVPGHVLEAGTYWFTLADSNSDRNIVEIWNSDRSQLIATILAIPDYRLQPADKTVVTFEERPTGSPEAIRAWFYPGDEFGQEFVYSKPRAVELAKQTSRPVLSVRDEQPPRQVTKDAVKAVNPSGEEIDFTEVVLLERPAAPVEQMQPVEQVQPVLSTLPHTGSSVPLIALCGLSALIGATVLSLAARQTS